LDPTDQTQKPVDPTTQVPADAPVAPTTPVEPTVPAPTVPEVVPTTTPEPAMPATEEPKEEEGGEIPGATLPPTGTPTIS
jgi:hypothetical protein